MLTHLLAIDSIPWFAWLLEVMLRSIVLLALATLAALACRRASAAQRHLLWTLTVIGVLLLPALSALLPAWPVLRLPEWRPFSTHVQEPAILPAPLPVTGDTIPAATPSADAQSSVTPVPVTAVGVPTTLSSPSAPISAAPPAPSRYMPILPWYLWATLTWAAGALLLLLRWGNGYLATRRLLRRAQPAPASWAALLAEVAGPLRARLLISDDIAMPIACGICHPAIVLPAAADEWTDDRRRIVLLHELAHIRRRDLLAHLLAQLACAFYWPNPLIWLAAHRLCAERETACDDAVLSAAVKASDYAAHLLAVAGLLQGRRLSPVLGIAMARSSRVGRRIRGVLDGGRNRRRMTGWGITILLLLVLPFLVIFAMADGADERQQVEEPAFTPIPLPASLSPSGFVVSPAGNHVAFVKTEGGKQVVVLDGKPGIPYEKIRAPWFDRKPVKGDDRPNYAGIFFSPDGTRSVYAIIKYTGPNGEDWYAGRQAMVIDGIEGKVYNEVSIPVFSSDNKHVAYAANTGAEWVVVLDGKELGPYDEIGGAPHFAPEVRSVVFSPIGTRLAYTVQKEKQWHVVVDGKEGPAYQDISHLTFSPDGTRVAYVARKGQHQTRMVVDGREEALQFMYAGPPVFSPNSQRLAYSATKAYDLNVLVVDGLEHPEFGCAGTPQFSPDSRRILVVASSGGKRPCHLIIDGKEFTSADQVLHPRFSPDSRQAACVVVNKDGIDARIAVDGKLLPFQAMGWPPVFSSDGARMAYIASINGKQAVVLDGKPLPGIDGWIYNLTFSPDGKHVVYQAHLKGEDKGAHVVVDGVMGAMYERILSATTTDLISEPSRTTIENRENPFFFTAPDRFHYFAVKDGAIQRVEVTIPSTSQPVAGAPYHGLVVSLECAKSYRAGQPVNFKVIEKNVGEQKISYAYLGFPYNYHLYLTDAGGKPIAKTARTLALEDAEDHPERHPREISMSALVELKPGEEYVRTYDLRQYFKAIPAGTYTLKVRRTARDIYNFTPAAGDRGALSLPCRFTITK